MEPSQVLALQLAENQVDELRKMVPKRKVPMVEEFVFDESLNIRYQDEAEWDRAYEEAAGVYRAFVREFGECMGRDADVADGRSMRLWAGQVLTTYRQVAMGTPC